MKKFLCFFLGLVFLLSSFTVGAAVDTTILVETVNVNIDEEIIVPIKISNNAGLCGGSFTVSYDSSLKLNSISKGEALATMSMTKPGDMTQNPFNLAYDGLEEDASNGVIAYLKFDSMTESGSYDISLSYEEGNIVDGKLQPLQITMINGKVVVSNSQGDNSSEEKEEPHNGPIITIGEVVAQESETIDVPVYLSQNTGICGLTLNFSYDEKLQLKQIVRGDALADCSITKPGVLTANPFTVTFDAIEEDKSDGLLLMLTFLKPSEDGVYNITATYDEGEIVNGKLEPVNVLIKNGNILVGAKGIEVVLGNQKIFIMPDESTNGKTHVAFYNNFDVLTSIKSYDMSESSIRPPIDSNASYAKIYCWTNSLKPLCDSEKIMLK